MTSLPPSFGLTVADNSTSWPPRKKEKNYSIADVSPTTKLELTNKATATPQPLSLSHCTARVFWESGIKSGALTLWRFPRGEVKRKDPGPGEYADEEKSKGNLLLRVTKGNTQSQKQEKSKVLTDGIRRKQVTVRSLSQAIVVGPVTTLVIVLWVSWLMMMLCIETSLSVNIRSKSSLQCLNCKLLSFCEPWRREVNLLKTIPAHRSQVM